MDFLKILVYTLLRCKLVHCPVWILVKTQNLAGHQGRQKTVNMTGLGLQSPFKLVKAFLVIWPISDKFLTRWFSGSSKTCLFRQQGIDRLDSSKISWLDNFLTSFLGLRFCVHSATCTGGLRKIVVSTLVRPISALSMENGPGNQWSSRDKICPLWYWEMTIAHAMKWHFVV